jgi:hypothetical protein
MAAPYLIEPVCVGPAGQFPDCKILRQWPRSELLVRSDDMDALLHPGFVQGGGMVRGSAVHNHAIW